jgi:hypothetical protein
VHDAGSLQITSDGTLAAGLPPLLAGRELPKDLSLDALDDL